MNPPWTTLVEKLLIACLVFLIVMLFTALFAFASRASADEASPAAVVVATDAPMNRVTLLAGIGPDGVQTAPTHGPQAGGVDVSPYYGPLVGLQYERVISGPWSASVMALRGVSVQSGTFVGAFGAGYSW